jgi:two-component system, NtrC family, response regulator AtoC
MTNKTTLPSQVMLEGIPKPYAIIDRNYQVVAANQSYCDKFGQEMDQVVGECCHRIEHQSDLPCSKLGQECPLDRALLDRQPVQLINIHPNLKGKDTPVKVTVTPICSENDEITYVGAFIEPVELEEAEHKVEQPRVLVGQSRALLKLTSLLYRAAPTQTTILVEGESGVGKECVANYVHQYSTRKTGPFMVVDCGALGESLIESELFGYEKGAFTGAAQRKKGLFEAADGGTLFIDEVGELPLELQTKLLRVLEMGTVRRLGGTDYIKVDVRVIAATNRNLLEMVDAGQFRQDLYYRLAAFPVFMPPLRERKEDIPALAEYFLCMMDEGYGQLPLSSEVIESLLSYDYPGNIRELRNILERAVILAAGEPMRKDHLVFPTRLEVRKTPDSVTVFEDIGRYSRSDQLLTKRQRLNDEVVMQMLERHNGHRGSAAQELGVSERTLYRHIKKLREMQQ